MDLLSSEAVPLVPSNIQVEGLKVPETILAVSDFWGIKTPPIKTRTASSRGTSQEVDPKKVVELTKDQTEKANEMVAQ